MIKPRQVGFDDSAAHDEILALLRAAFAYMEGRIDPPSSLHRLTVAGIAEQARQGEVWVIGAPVRACVFLTPKPGRLYLGKLAVASEARGQGFATALMSVAEVRARVLNLPLLELQTRIELTENHATFRRLGFAITAEGRHPGYDRTTDVTMQKPVQVP